VVLANNAKIFAQTVVDVDSSLWIDGTLIRPTATPGGGIIKQGAGELRLSGNNDFTGLTIVNAGLLTLNGSIESDLLVNEGIVQGVGTVNGTVDIHGTLRPGFNVGSFTTDLCEFYPGSILEIDLATGGVTDRLNVAGPLILNEDVTLKLNVLGDFEPEVGQAFNIVDALAVAGHFDHFDLPILDQAEWNFDLFESFGIVTIIESEPIVGDVNQDGVVNLLDVAPFVELLAIGNFQAEADINDDSAVNLLDVEPFIALLAG
jgi:autotransporter-associated beta strand protein